MGLCKGNGKHKSGNKENVKESKEKEAEITKQLAVLTSYFDSNARLAVDNPEVVTLDEKW